MNYIYKYQLAPIGEQQVWMPDGATLLSVQEQQGCLCLWAMVDLGRQYVNRTIRILGTGHEAPDDPGVFISTTVMHGGTLVLHAFDGGES